VSTAIDIALALCLVLTLIAGARNGFFREGFTLAGLAAGILLALRFATPILDRGPSFVRGSAFAWTVLFALIFVAAFAVLGFAGRLLASTWEGKNVPGFSRVLGLVLGGIRGYVLLVFLAAVAVLLAPAGSRTLGESRVLPYLEGGVRWGANLVLPSPTRQRLLQRWELLPFSGREAAPPVPTGSGTTI